MAKQKRTQFEDPKKAPTSAQAAERAARLLRVPGATGVSPGRIARCLNEYRSGEFREAAAVFEKIELYDTQILSCSEKRSRDISGLDWEIAEVDFDRSDTALVAQANLQREVLQDFYDTIVASDVRKLDMRGGISDLVFQLMSAVGYGYACAEIKWLPARLPDGRGTYHAETLFCPLSYFEALNRELAIRTNPADVYGTELAPDSWLVAAYPGKPLLATSALVYMLKQTPLEDWAIAVEKYAMPNIVANTQAAKGTRDWDDTLDTLRSFGNDYAGLFGSGTVVQLLRGLEGTPPHRDLVDHLDRALSVLWRGGDLSTTSRAEGEGTGVTMQAGELSKIQKSDRLFMASTLDSRLTKPLLRFVFGEKVHPLVYFNFKIDNTGELKSRLDTVERLARIGLKIPSAQLYADFGIQRPENGEETVGGTQAAQDFGGNVFANEADPADALLAEAEAASLEAFTKAREHLEKIADPEKFRAELQKLKADFPALAEDLLSRPVLPVPSDL